jgi:uncharacterized membrane protein YgcG
MVPITIFHQFFFDMKKVFQCAVTVSFVLLLSNQVVFAQKSVVRQNVECAGVVAMSAAGGLALGAPLGGLPGAAGAASFAVISFSTSPACEGTRGRLEGSQASGGGSGAGSASGGGGGSVVVKTNASRVHKW